MTTFDPTKDKSNFESLSDFDKAMQEVSEVVRKLEKNFGAKNLRVLVAYGCSFGGNVRGLETKMKYVDEVIQTLKGMESARAKQS